MSNPEKVSGLGKRKQEILKKGGNVLDLAVAILETKHMMVTDYPFGDVYPPGHPKSGELKTGNAANFGIFKQNWFMISSLPRYDKKNDWKKEGKLLNDNLNLDIMVLHESQDKYRLDGLGLWFAGHRNGESGLKNPQTQDIKKYRSAVEWIMDQINAKPIHQSDDMRFWVDVKAI